MFVLSMHQYKSNHLLWTLGWAAEMRCGGFCSRHAWLVSGSLLFLVAQIVLTKSNTAAEELWGMSDKHKRCGWWSSSSLRRKNIFARWRELFWLLSCTRALQSARHVSRGHHWHPRTPAFRMAGQGQDYFNNLHQLNGSHVDKPVHSTQTL